MVRQLPVLLSVVISSRDKASIASSQSLLHIVSLRQWNTRRSRNLASDHSSSNSTIIVLLHRVVLRRKQLDHYIGELISKKIWIPTGAA